MLLFAVHPVEFVDPFDSTARPPLVVAVIPARFDASRLPGKPLADIAGRPMVEHVYRRASAARLVGAVVVATDDARVAAAVERFGGIARMTSASHRTGTDRIAEVAANLSCDIVVNVQGDEPLIEPAMIDQVVEPLVNDPAVDMTTAYCIVRDPADHANPNVVKVVVDRRGRALYFSRAAIPHRRDGRLTPQVPVFKHIGLYGYRRRFLLAFSTLPQTPLELSESLEQLRALEHGHYIHTVETQHDSIGVDTPEDLDRVRRHLLAATART